MTGSLLPAKDTVETIDLGISQNLNRVAQDVVKSKAMLDAAAAEFRPSMLERGLHDGGYGPAEPLPFLHRIVPFAYTIQRPDDTFFARVPTTNTIGCSWAWHRGTLDDAEKLKRRHALDNNSALLAGTLNEAVYYWIKPLGLIAPHEGKNRVDFFRGEGLESIPAKVTECSYAEPGRVVLYAVKDHAFEATWAVLDGRWVEPVNNPNWTVPLMAAYGAKTELPWPETFPAPADVMLALFDQPRTNSPLGNPDHDHATVIDLDTIKAIDEFQSESVRATVHDLKDVRIDPRIWQYSLAAVVAVISLMLLLPEQWTDARMLCAIVLGAAGCAGMLPYLFHIITVPRRGLAKEQYLPRERCPKNAGRKSRRLLG